MDKFILNPFDLTKAGDLSDRQISDLWVDIPGKATFADMVKPASRMPMFIVGGKGSGKTHLMRYLSFPLQQMRNRENLLDGLARDGYIGIYVRCDGLNANRFSAKGRTPELWQSVFAYYMELWLGQLTLQIVKELLDSRTISIEDERSLCRDILMLLDKESSAAPESISLTIAHIKKLQRSVDIAVNNAVSNRKSRIPILATPGSLLFGIPKLLVKRIKELKNLIFIYLIDEFENISEEQQRYLQTLVREKSFPCSFKIGARLNGIKTYSTYSSEEENKEGSEFETIFLDDELRKNKNYSNFARQLVLKRLLDAGLVKASDDGRNKQYSLDSFFKSLESSDLQEEDLAWIAKKYKNGERPYFRSLRKKLIQGWRANHAQGIKSIKDIDQIISLLSCPQYPLLEKVNVFILYQSWAKPSDLKEAANNIERECKQFVRDRSVASKYKTVWGHFKGDLLAQMLRECDSKQHYLGLRTFIAMSQGFPRNLLNILKHVYNSSIFNGEQPFVKGLVSVTSQREGVSAASNWFFEDARSTGDEGANPRDAISRLAELFRDIRFSDKPSECSLVTFSCSETNISTQARHMIALAEKVSLLIKIRQGQRDRNTQRVDSKYQLNAMLAPRWDLPISRRGAIALSVEETNAIFDPQFTADFSRIARKRVDRMAAPYFGKMKENNPSGKDVEERQKTFTF